MMGCLEPVDGRAMATDAALLVLHGHDAALMARGSHLAIDGATVIDLPTPKAVHLWENAD